MVNQTLQYHFILAGLTTNLLFQIFSFSFFLLIYLLTLAGNIMILLAIRTSSRLQSPMYFFLSHLSFLDVCYSSVTLPKMLETLVGKKTTISVAACFTQAFCIMLSASTETFLLSSMAYDRYSAICQPLHYMETMNIPFCQKLVAGSWIIGLSYAFMNTFPLLKLQFCGSNIIQHFACELPPILFLSCSETFMNHTLFFISGGAVGLVSLLLTVLSYVYILSTILRINSREGRKKAFSTCSSHFAVVILFYGTGAFRYLRPSSTASVIVDELLSIQYCIFTPLLNPIIYSLQNKEVKAVFKKILRITFCYYDFGGKMVHC